MDPAVQKHLDSFADRYRSATPEGWVRIVTWWAKLGESADQTSVASTTCAQEVIMRSPQGELSQRPINPSDPPLQDLWQLEPLLAGTPHEGWTLLKVEIEPDRIVRADFEHGEPVRTETFLTSGWAAEVHQYLERHRDELDQFDRPAAGRERRRWNPFGR